MTPTDPDEREPLIAPGGVSAPVAADWSINGIAHAQRLIDPDRIPEGAVWIEATSLRFRKEGDRWVYRPDLDFAALQQAALDAYARAVADNPDPPLLDSPQ